MNVPTGLHVDNRTVWQGLVRLRDRSGGGGGMNLQNGRGWEACQVLTLPKKQEKRGVGGGGRVV